MAKKPVEVQSITAQEMRTLAIQAKVNVPIEQTWVWAEFEETFPDRDLVGFFSVTVEGQPIAIFGMTHYHYHGFEFLWIKHGPVWLRPEDEELERGAVYAIVRWIKKHRPRTAFVRMHLRYPYPGARPPMQITTYDRTVIVSLADNEDDLMTGFKRRARTKVRGVLRKTPLAIEEETEAAIADMSPYYAIMAETADRQGFTPWSREVYENLLRTLKRPHARLYAARVDGEVVGFAIFTLSGSEAVYYYAAANDLGRQNEASIQILYRGLVDLGKEGFETMDLMGVGSDLAPSLNVLTAFKSGFSQEICEVSPAYDIPVNKTLFKALEMLRGGKSKVDTLKSKLNRSEKDD